MRSPSPLRCWSPRCWSRPRGAAAAIALVLVTLAGRARAEVEAAMAVGAGQRAQHSYVSLEARLDARWPSLELSLGLRGQWDRGQWRRDDFVTARGWAAMLRALQWRHAGAHREVALALGTLRPVATGHVTDGVQAGVDDQRHTGARVYARAERLEARAELDDVVAPELVAVELAFDPAFDPPFDRPFDRHAWRVAAAVAAGLPATGATAGATEAATEVAVELSLARRIVAAPAGAGEDAAPDQAQLGGGLIVEPGAGVHGVAFAELSATAARWRMAVRTELRAGNGSLGARFGPLYRIDRRELALAAAAPGPGDPGADGDAAASELAAAVATEHRLGLAGAIAVRAERPALGWFEAMVRVRRQRGAIAVVHLGAPLTSQVQAGTWLAVDARHLVMAAEVRAAGRGGSFAALELSHLMREPAATMAVPLSWAAIAWVGVAR